MASSQGQAAHKVGKVAVVVGVGAGAGAGIAKKFAEQKYKVALVSRRIEPLQSIEAEIKTAGGEAISIAADTGKESDVVSAHGKIVEAFRAYPEVLIYNAGPGMKYPPPPLLETKVDDFARTFDAGVVGALAWIHQVLPEQIKAGRGTIIFTGATASLRGGSKFAPLACPKFALRALSQSAAREFQSKGIHVAHVIIDGLIDSPRIRTAYPNLPPDSALTPQGIAEEYWKLHTQHKSTWTQELDLRPYTEKW